jgi:hypothetical protein
MRARTHSQPQAHNKMPNDTCTHAHARTQIQMRARTHSQLQALQAHNTPNNTCMHAHARTQTHVQNQWWRESSRRVCARQKCTAKTTWLGRTGCGSSLSSHPTISPLSQRARAGTAACMSRIRLRRYVCMYVCMDAWMYVCMYVCMYACMYVCMYVYTYVCMYACMYLCIYLAICLRYIMHI